MASKFEKKMEDYSLQKNTFFYTLGMERLMDMSLMETCHWFTVSYNWHEKSLHQKEENTVQVQNCHSVMTIYKLYSFCG